ncbi:MAG TPA: xanthine dehydrogenase family protein molybdopterin-binding subunit [Acidimicrobiia bacterium]
MALQGSILGNPVKRKEDPGILTGSTQYFDDLAVDGLAHIAFVRSTIAHATLDAVDVSEAEAMPGVIAIYTADTMELADHNGFVMLPPTMLRAPLAKGKVRFVGDIVAAVVAETKGQAVDAAEAVIVDYDPLPALASVEDAIADGAVLVHDGAPGNIAFGAAMMGMGTPVDDVFDDADVVVKGRFVNQRVAGIPMEPSGIVAIPEQDGAALTAWIPCQNPHAIQGELAGTVGLDPANLRVRTAAVGGGFGSKAAFNVEFTIASKAALALGRPVKWTETRSENLLAMVHGRGQVQHVELGLKRDGTITGLRVNLYAETGAYPTIGAFLPFFTHTMSTGVNTVPKLDFNWSAVVTNTTPVGAYRGAGRPEATQLIERILDIAADELGIDPVEIRRTNLIPKFEAPGMAASSGLAMYDTGDYAAALDAALEHSDYSGLRTEQARRREANDPKQFGIGVSCYVEVTAPAGMHMEYGAIEVHEDGTVDAIVGTSAHGQGHDTAFSMIVSELLGVPMENVRLIQSDTALVPRGNGTAGSRSLQTAGSAVYRASEGVLDKAKQLAAQLLEASPDDIVVGDGGLQVAGVPSKLIAWGELAAQAKSSGIDGLEAGLRHELDFDGTGSTFPFGAHVAVVEVDTETGRVTQLRHVAVDDCGRILNPLLVTGQQHGGIAQGIAQALYEWVQYDADGNPVTANLMDYAMPSAAEFPSFETYNTETPTHLNPLGANGIGESGTIGSTPAVHNAVVDALSPFGITHVDMPLTSERVWAAIQRARG